MEIKATSTYDLKTLKAFVRLNMFRKANPKKRMIIWGIIALLLTILIIAELITFGNSSGLLISLIVLWFAIGWYCYIYFLLPKIRYKATCKFADLKNNFIFTENQFEVFSNSDSYNGSCNMEYSMIFKVMETSEYIFIYQNKLQAYIVDKSTLEGGTIEQLRNLIINIIGKKYIICNY